MQLEGSLTQFSLRELIEMVVYSSVAGVIEVRVGDQIGQIFFRDGLPYHALVGEMAGVDAVCRIFEERDALFRFLAGPECFENTLWMDPWELIEHAERQAQLWSSVRPHIPSLDLIPSLRGNTGAEQIHISEATWPVLSAIDGQRSIMEIARVLSLAPIDTCLALVDLLSRGLVFFRQSLASPLGSSSFAPEKQGSEQPASGGFFERLMAGISLDDDLIAPPPPPEVPDDEEMRARDKRYQRYHPQK